jgi:hypothetical protein
MGRETDAPMSDPWTWIVGIGGGVLMAYAQSHHWNMLLVAVLSGAVVLGVTLWRKDRTL